MSFKYLYYQLWWKWLDLLSHPKFDEIQTKKSAKNELFQSFFFKNIPRVPWSSLSSHNSQHVIIFSDVFICSYHFWWFFDDFFILPFSHIFPEMLRGPSEVLLRTKALSADSVASAVTAQAPSGRGAKTTATAVPVSFEYVPHIVHMFRHSFCWFCWFCWQLVFCWNLQIIGLIEVSWTHWKSFDSDFHRTRLVSQAVANPSPHLPIQGTEKTCKLRNGDAFTSSTQRCEALKVKVLRFLEVLRHNNTIAL